MAAHSPVRPSAPRFAQPTPLVAVVPEPTLTPAPTPTHAIPPPRISGVQLVSQEAAPAAIVLPKAEHLPVLSIPPFDGARKRRRGIIVVVTMLLLVVGAFVATAVASQLAH